MTSSLQEANENQTDPPRTYSSSTGRRRSSPSKSHSSVSSYQDVLDTSSQPLATSFANATSMTIREEYAILKAKYRYIQRENQILQDEYIEAKRKMKRHQLMKNMLVDEIQTKMYQEDAA
jgi:membrane-associated HD superfamily phosphohydrolase